MRQRFGPAASILLMAGALAGCATVSGPRPSGSAGAADEPLATTRAAAPVAAPRCAPAPCAPLCGLPCESGEASWHVRAVGGVATWAGDDPGNPCTYLGADIGRTLCGCWGIDAFYRTQSARFDRDPAGLDGGDIHHLGVKATYERSLGGRFYAWGGVGPEYFWTSDYLDDDSGFGAFGEAGLGFVLNRTWRARLGVNVHGFDSDVARRSPADDGRSRWLWVIAPVAGLEIDF